MVDVECGKGGIPLSWQTLISLNVQFERIRILQVIMLFWQVCKVPILKNLLQFVLCLGSSFSPPSPTTIKGLILHTIVGSRNVQINCEELLNLHDLLFYELTQLVCFSFQIGIKSFPFNTFGFEIHCSNTSVLHSYSSFCLGFFDTSDWSAMYNKYNVG